MSDAETKDDPRDLRDPLFPPSAMTKLFGARTVLLYGEITSALAERVGAQLLALAAVSREPIRMLVHSQGGHVEAGDSIHDIVRFIEPEVRMIGTGWVASAGALVFVAAKPENRFALPNTRFLLHQPLGGVGGAASDIEIETRQILAMRERLNRIFARETKQPYERIVADTQRNFWMNAAEAKEYGLVARIVERHTEV
jgi:ATP-dependent Clp protease protease subunit